MELLIKLYIDKPSKIGIKYTYGYQAVKAYEDLMRSLAGNTFVLKLESSKQKINLILQSEQSGKRSYTKTWIINRCKSKNWKHFLIRTWF